MPTLPPSQPGYRNGKISFSIRRFGPTPKKLLELLVPHSSPQLRPSRLFRSLSMRSLAPSPGGGATSCSVMRAQFTYLHHEARRPNDTGHSILPTLDTAAAHSAQTAKNSRSLISPSAARNVPPAAAFFLNTACCCRASNFAERFPPGV